MLSFGTTQGQEIYLSCIMESEEDFKPFVQQVAQARSEAVLKVWGSGSSIGDRGHCYLAAFFVTNWQLTNAYDMVFVVQLAHDNC